MWANSTAYRRSGGDASDCRSGRRHTGYCGIGDRIESHTGQSGCHCRRYGRHHSLARRPANAAYDIGEGRGLTLVTHVAADAEDNSPTLRLPTVPTVTAARSVWFEADANSANRTPARRGIMVCFDLAITPPL